MARGYIDDGRAGSTLASDPPTRPPPSRPARRIDSVRGRGDDGGSSYRGGHYAESPVIVNMQAPGPHAAGVNFINVLHERFLYKSKLSSFSLVTFGLVPKFCTKNAAVYH